ncbi:serine/threonine-protein kinase MARK1 [Platysternon megacephalum]|uniref:Serine/threonine-protein kinase MARK1 n=1 Tax=Platysternon megacephalum TaxID=55544 RepID=A0A4D9DFV0_9SAUR|nr:serine/threonine-protein kinase MARK1 [Platysternon megacephalum]
MDRAGTSRIGGPPPPSGHPTSCHSSPLALMALASGCLMPAPLPPKEPAGLQSQQGWFGNRFLLWPSWPRCLGEAEQGACLCQSLDLALGWESTPPPHQLLAC